MFPLWTSEKLGCACGHWERVVEMDDSTVCPDCWAFIEKDFVYCGRCGIKVDHERVLITHYFEKGFEYEKIVAFLAKFHGLVMSLRTLNLLRYILRTSSCSGRLSWIIINAARASTRTRSTSRWALILCRQAFWVAEFPSTLSTKIIIFVIQSMCAALNTIYKGIRHVCYSEKLEHVWKGTKVMWKTSTGSIGFQHLHPGICVQHPGICGLELLFVVRQIMFCVRSIITCVW